MSLSPCLPERRSHADRLDPVSAPPGAFIAAPMKFAVVRSAQRHCELVTDLLAKSPRLRKAQMMRVAGLPATDEAGLSGHEAQVLSVALPQHFWDCERSPINPRCFTWTDPCGGLRRFRGLAWPAHGRQACVQGLVEAFGIFQAKHVDVWPRPEAPLVEFVLCCEWLEVGGHPFGNLLGGLDRQGARARRAAGLSRRPRGATC